MITKSRLEELIKEGATIYDKYRSYSLKNEKYISSDFSYERTAEIKDNKLHYTYEDSDYYEDFDKWFELEQLFETKEEAEWALKYQRIPRTEWLDLPTWEEFCRHKYVSFNDEFCNHYELKLNKNSKLIITKYPADWEIFYEPATEENYEKACDLCVKLFKGE